MTKFNSFTGLFLSTVAEPPADLAAESSWYGERSANAIESLFRSISN